MTTRSICTSLLALTFVLAPAAVAQFSFAQMEFGLGAGLYRGVTDFSKDDLQPLFRAGLRYQIHDLIKLEGSGEIGTIGNDVYKTSIMPQLAFSALFSPFWKKTFAPYAYAGVGLVHTEVTTSPLVAPSGTALMSSGNNGWDTEIPLGVGLHYRVSDLVAINGNFGYHYVIDQRRLEQAYGDNTDGMWDFNIMLWFGGDDGSGDKDGDGLIDRLEKQWRTDRENADSDGDGISDGEEVNRTKTDPLRADSDADGLSDKTETAVERTDPIKADSDGDGLSDGDEVNTIKTDPLKPDTDGDGLTDKEEAATFKTNPLKADSDGDGWSDGDEARTRKTDPLKADTDADGLDDAEEASKYKCDPLDADSDDDGLNDGDEAMKYLTNPLNADTDGDGLSDGSEVTTSKTNPKLVDSDYDGIPDGVEVKNGSDPMNPSSPGKPKEPAPEALKAEVGKALVLEGVVFTAGKATINKESEEVLQRALKTFIENFDLEVEIRGYTDDVGDAKRNLKLSQDRAEAVKRWLVFKGVDASRIAAKGFGEENPIADNKTPAGRAQNRRIEFYRIK